MATTILPTCLTGIEIALKWGRQQGGDDVALSTAEVAHGCTLRHTCRFNDQCADRLAALDVLIADIRKLAPADSHGPLPP